MKAPRLRIAELCLFAVGAVLIGKAAMDLWAGHSFQIRTQKFTQGSTRAEVSSAPATPVGFAKTKILGSLRVPKLALSVTVVEGDGNDQLRLAAGHVGGTPLPGQPGNSVIAGHRDTVFYDLRKIANGDGMEFADRNGVQEYRVSSTRIVDPEEVSVMNNSDGRRLTLVTCYPFSFIGPAPKRFVVVAEAETAK